MLNFRIINRLLILGCLAVCFTACQEEDPIFDPGIYEGDYADSPVFQFTNQSTETEIQAGVKDFYMYATYDFLSNDEVVFNSQFIKLESCSSDCEESLIFYLKSVNTEYTSGDILNSQAVVLGNYDFSEGQDFLIGNISIQYTSVDGITYRSDLAAQPSESYFIVNAVSDYLKNENNDPTKLVELELSCLLKAIDGEQLIEFTDATATVAIAFPE